MPSSKPVRTYLDPDAVGPLPRSPLADDSDALASAKTKVLVRDATQELGPDDMLEVVDPNRTPDPVATAPMATMHLPRQRVNLSTVGSFVAGVAVVGVVFLVRAAVSGPGAPTASATPAATVTEAVMAPVTQPVPAPTIAPPAAGSASAHTGILRSDGPLVFVDGAPSGLAVAVVPCGPHEVSVGEPGHARTIDVPCGGEVTVFR